MKKTLLIHAIFTMLIAYTELHAQLIHSESIHLEMGIPIDKNASNDYLIIRPQYALSYNQELNIPNWVSWNLHRGWFGDVPRFSGNFIQDTSLPAEFYRVKHGDYTGSGYDRGHMVRSEERTATAEDNKSTFLLTNIMPQTPTLNQQTWLSLEFECERLCKDQNKELFIVAGGINGNNPQRLNTVVAVPDAYWKVIVILDSGQRVSDITNATKVIAVLMNNKKYESGTTDWKLYTTTVNEIEEKAGYDILSDVPKNVQELLESRNYLSIDQEMPSNDMIIAPNPAQDRLGIMIPGNESQTSQISIVDILGNTMSTSQVMLMADADGYMRHQLSLQGLSSGSYILIIQNGAERFVEPFIKSE